ncbi:MAG: hypothetical protein LBP81_08250 [Treponema sp.]|jgi:hypothetical protein|nr:hypothetical protein [Treponema sp.]
MTSDKIEQLHCKFKKLSEENQHFIIGYSEGLRQAQNSFSKNSSNDKSAAESEKIKNR